MSVQGEKVPHYLIRNLRAYLNIARYNVHVHD